MSGKKWLLSIEKGRNLTDKDRFTFSSHILVYWNIQQEWPVAQASYKTHTHFIPLFFFLLLKEAVCGQLAHIKFYFLISG